MNSLEAVKVWQEWARKNKNFAGDVTVPDSPDSTCWFPDECAKAGAGHFHCFANGGGGSMIALWSMDGKGFANAPVVVLGHEGQVAFLAPTVPEAVALFAAAGSAPFEDSLSFGELGDADSKLSTFVKKTFGVSVPTKFANPARKSTKLVKFLEKITGNEYECYSF